MVIKMMKKRVGVLAAVLASATLLTACGSKEYLKDIKASDYVTLGNYMGIEAQAEEPVVEDGLESAFPCAALAERPFLIPDQQGEGICIAGKTGSYYCQDEFSL